MRGHRRIGRVAVVSTLALLTGCLGTLARFGQQSQNWCGWPPMSGVIEDWHMGDGAGCKAPPVQMIGFFCMPFDLAFDIVLLPLDLVGGAFGARRFPARPGPPESKDASPERPAR